MKSVLLLEDSVERPDEIIRNRTTEFVLQDKWGVSSLFIDIVIDNSIQTILVA